MKTNLIKMIKTLMFLSFISALSLTVSCSRNSGNKIVIKGSTTVLPITQKVAEAFRGSNKISISIEGSGSGNGIKALIDGSCDIANASRQMKPKEIKKAKEKGIKAKEITVAYDMIVPVVHPSNPVKNLSMNQLKAIYSGSITNWKEVGGKDQRIVVISRDTSSGTYEVWYKKVMKKTDVKKEALLQASNGAVIAAVSENSKAVGYIGFGYLNNSVKGLNVNGISKTLANGKSGKFPISRKLYMYVNSNKISADTRKFIDFILSKKGQKLVKEAGYISL